MSPDERIEWYLDRVCIHIHWRGYRARVRRELRDHIWTRAEYLMHARGFTEECAVIQAVSLMGDPDELGHALLQARRPRRKFAFLLASCALWAAIAFCALYLLLHLPF